MRRNYHEDINKNICADFIVAMITAFFEMPMSAMDSTLLAFPGAEGGGKYTQGARASSSRKVYHVTNLNAKGIGSFADAVSSSNRIIVFDVGGTIDMQGGQIKVNGSNLTILGQTAPGDGITVTGGDLVFANGIEQVIMRYIRVRPTDKYGGEPDGIGGRWNKNIIVDHCSASWSVDELMTLYAGSSESGTPGANITVQNTLAAESLRMSNHFKGAHGYGGIFGATYSTWYHNLLAHHDSRSPRLDRELQYTDIRNNIIYNWGQTNSAYGGEPYSYNNKTQNGVYVNYSNNYYKYGPATKTTLRSRIFQMSNPKDAAVDKAQFYFNGNYVYDYSDVTSNNQLGIVDSDYATQLTSPLSMGNYELTNTSETAEQAYDAVLSDVGATLPKRDAIDARIINDVKNQTGRIINNADEVGGFIQTETTTRTFEIPSDWKTANGMGSSVKETDIVSSGIWAGYTWIEAYVNDWTQKQSAPTNPSITVTNPAIQDMDSLGSNNNWAVIKDNETVTYSAVAAPVGDTTISKIEIYDGSTLIKTVNSASVNEALKLSAGTHYLTSRAYNSKGETTQSPTSIVYVKGTSGTGEYTHAQIGTESAFNGQGGSWVKDGVCTIMGSGNIASSNGLVLTGRTSDSCDFMYKTVTGDFDIKVKREQIPKFENGEVCGIMMRETLDPGSKMVMLTDGWLKYGENVSIISRAEAGSKSEISYFKNISGDDIQNNSSYDTSNAAYTMPEYLRMQRSGNTITLSVSNDGATWTNNPRQPETITLEGLSDTVYLGLAVDSVQGTPMKEYMAEAKFVIVTPTPTSTPSPSPSPKPTTSADSTPNPDSPEKYAEYIFDQEYNTGLAAGTPAAAAAVTKTAGLTSVPVLTKDNTDKSYMHQAYSDKSKYTFNLPLSLESHTWTETSKGSRGKGFILDAKLSGNNACSYDLYVIYGSNGLADETSLKVTDTATGSQIGDTDSTIGFAPKTAVFKGIKAERIQFVLDTNQGRMFYVGIEYNETASTPIPSPSPKPTATASPTSTPTAKPTATASPTAKPTATALPTSSPTVKPSASPEVIPISYNRDTRTAVITLPANQKATVIFASYNEKGVLTSLSLRSEQEISSGGSTVTADDTFKNDTTVKIYVWDTISNMKPVVMGTF